MKRFITTALAVSVLFIGLGAIVDNVGAKFKSDEKALEIVRAARIAIGGEASLREIRGLVIVGKTTNTVKINGVERSETGDAEIALQLPDKMMKMIKMGDGNGEAVRSHMVTKDVFVTRNDGDAKMRTPGDGTIRTADGKEFTVTMKGGQNGEFITEDGKKVIVRSIEKGETTNVTATGDGVEKVIVRKRSDGGEPVQDVIIRKKDDGGTWTTDDGKHIEIAKAHGPGHDGMRQNELLRTTLGLLLTAPEGMDVSYTFVGEGDVDGTAVNIVNATFAGADYKLFISRSNSLPVAISFKGHAMPAIVHFDRKSDGGDAKKDVVIMRKMEGPAPAPVESMIKFSDFRATGSVQLPYKWTTVSGGQTTEVFDVASYDVNPANIADRFNDQNVKIRVKAPGTK